MAGQLIETTAEHPFWVVGRGWTPVWDLSIGDALMTITGESVSVEGVHETDRRQTVYNLRVAEDHTDVVGCDEWGFSVWAHNAEYVHAHRGNGKWGVKNKETGEWVKDGENVKLHSKDEAVKEAQRLTKLANHPVSSKLRDVTLDAGIAHAEVKHLSGDGPLSLKTLDPGGTREKWLKHITELAESGTGGTLKQLPTGETLELIAPMALESGGQINVGVTLFRKSGDTQWRLNTILTRQ
ncbi:polymorphic toxin-type HINT domain-containing protein [Tuwongella immobilis]|uniref:polymorphic toxin-type HINT domain-containing protein n=1 Tax=Tuwongella immobilis TaxID=692036 RepID=UPI0013A6BCBC|nr:polymorphic toxin-type HINT domain-containing protein [Tuwongella immobilis]